MTPLSSLFAVMIATLLPNTTQAAPIELRSGPQSTALLELYSSEGCSSCPPAEKWLTSLKTHPKLWTGFVPVAFHVDYWDYLGWVDPYGAPEFSQRQRIEAKGWKNGSVYTPGFVLDGNEWRGWFNREQLPELKTRPAGILSARSDDRRTWTVHYDPVEPLRTCDFYAALLGFELKTQVKAGENSGKTLEHDFVVLTLATVTAKKTNNGFEANLALNPKSGPTPKRFALAIWVTESGNLRPIQTLGGWL